MLAIDKEVSKRDVGHAGKTVGCGSKQALWWHSSKKAEMN
jgi:hypothetical protein